jgi:hypothetical protein
LSANATEQCNTIVCLLHCRFWTRIMRCRFTHLYLMLPVLPWSGNRSDFLTSPASIDSSSLQTTIMQRRRAGTFQLNMVAKSLQGDDRQSHITYDFTSPCKSDSEHSSISRSCIRELVCQPLRCTIPHFEIIYPPPILTIMVSKIYGMIVC